MASKQKKKSKESDVSSSSSLHSVQHSQSTQMSKVSRRSRAKKYTQAETEALLQICDEFHRIINSNSNTDTERKIKASTWETIKEKFDTYCKSQGIYVSCFHTLAVSICIRYCI